MIVKPKIVKSKPKEIKFGIYIILLSLFIILPLLSFSHSNILHTINAEVDTTNSLVIGNNNIIQNIYLQGDLKEFTLYLSKSLTQETENEVIVTLSQNNKVITCSLPISKIKSNQYNVFKGDFSKFDKGTVSVKISLKDKELEGNTIKCYLSNDYYTGLPNATANGEELNNCLAVNYQIYKFNNIYIYNIFLYLSLVVIIIFTSYTICFRDDWIQKYNLLYLCSVCIITLVICIRQPVASYLGEPISETAYDFWYNANKFNLLENLGKLEAGLYLSWLQRIIAYISTNLFDSTKYVFVIMQMFQTIFIACVCSLVCLKFFSKFFENIWRILFAFFLGTQLIWQHGYLYHILGYWGIFIIIALLFSDLNKLKKWKYIVLYAIACVCCFSKMYYVVLIPVSIYLLLLKNLQLSKRHKLLCIGLMISASLQFVLTYQLTRTVIASREGLGTIQLINPKILINNIIYYQVQVLNSFFLNKESGNPLFVNLFFLMVMVIMIVWWIRSMFSKRATLIEKRVWGAIGGLGVMSLSSIAINIITDSSTSVDLTVMADWNNTTLMFGALFSQQHYFFCKVALAIMCLVATYGILNRCVIFKEMTYGCNGVLVIIFTLAFIQFTPQYNRYYNGIEEFPTEWKKVYKVTNNESYYIPINVGYPHSLISLCENSFGVLIGYDLDDNWKQLFHAQPYNENHVYQSAIIGEVKDIKENPILSISVKKANVNFDAYYDIILYDKTGNILDRVTQSNSPNRRWIDFMFDKPISNIYSVEFVHTLDNTPAYITDALNIGVSTIGNLEDINKDIDEITNTRELKLIDKLPVLEEGYTISLEYMNNQIILGEKSIDINSEDNYIKFVGWGADNISQAPFKDIYLKCGDFYFKTVYGLERQDVVDATNLQDMLYTGFTIEVPISYLEDIDKIEFIAISTSGVSKFSPYTLSVE